MSLPTYKNLLDAGVHFGHQKRKWNPRMAPYIFMERKGIHVIDLNRTLEGLERSGKALQQIAKSGKKILFVATKKQSRQIVKEAAMSVGMPYVTERWLGGMMTNFSTIRRSVKKKQKIESMLTDANVTSITKKERLTLSREKDKLNKVLGGIENMTRLPAAVFIIDIAHEHLAVAESHKLNIKTFGLVDTNSDPNNVDFAIPGNDDASKSIEIIATYIASCIKEGLSERQSNKEAASAAAEKKAADKKTEAKVEKEETKA